MASRIQIFDHFMKPLAEINAATTPRSWVLNEIGRCEFSMSTSDPACTEKNLQYGNLILITHVPTQDAAANTNGRLPVWVGMILPPRTWDYGILHAVAYSAESVFSFRAMPHLSLKGYPKEMFYEIIKHTTDYANNIIIHPGIVDDVPVTLGEELRLSAFDHIRSIAKNAGMDFDVTSQLDQYGNLELFANLYQHKGQDTSLELSNLNSELSSPLLTEQGVPANHVIGYAQASTKASRFQGVGRNQEAINDYGSLQANIVFMGQKDSGGVTVAAQTLAATRGRPVKMMKRIALDREDTFSFLDTGNIVKIKEADAGFSPSGGFGFDARVRILSMEYNDLSNKTSLNVELVL